MIGVINFFGISVAEADFFNFIDKIISGVFSNNTEKLEAVPNSQTALLLKSTLNVNPIAGLGGGGINIVNQSALMADIGPLGTIADIESGAELTDRISIYVVREGDSLSQIAKMFGVSANTIIWSNNISKGDLIKIGQELVILPVTGVRYTVKKGDTLSSVAKQFKGDIDEITEFNGLEPDAALAVGAQIIIPDGEAPYTSSVVRAASNPLRGASSVEYEGYYMRPIEGGVRTQGLHGYNGIDLATSCGEPIYASASGEVIISRSYGWNGGYGNYIVISHGNGTQTLYSHNSENIVSAGWNVTQGQVIGYIGSTGKSTGCHVHFEVRGAKNPF